jgi:hypothetical protein
LIAYNVEFDGCHLPLTINRVVGGLNMFFCKVYFGFVVFMFATIVAATFSLAESLPPVTAIEHEKIGGLPTQWTPVPREDYIKVVKLLQAQNQSNLANLHTVKGVYAVESSSYYSTKDMASAGLSSSVDAIKTLSFDLDFVADVKRNYIFRKKIVTGHVFRRADNNEEINAKNVRAMQHISVMKNDTYVEHNMQRHGEYREMPDYPDLLDKTVAKKAWSTKIKNWQAEYPNPLEPLDHMNWDPFDVAIRSLLSKNAAIMKTMATSFFIFEADSVENGKKLKWYSFQVISDDTTFHRKVVHRTFWSEASGFNPVGLVFNEIKNDGSEKFFSLLKADWKNFGGVFVPSMYLTVLYLPPNDRFVSSRRITAKDLVVNAPLSADQFEFSALGLKDGDYLLDGTNKRIYSIQDNKPVYVARFHAKYKSPGERRTNTVRLIILVAGFVLIAIGVYMKIRNNRKRNET